MESSRDQATNDFRLRTRLDAIDGLRAFAVLSVIAYHFNTGFAPSGYVGVDIFFAISGYVIALTLTQNPGHSVFQYIGGFYKRRILRIMPALVVCLLATGVFSQLFIPGSWLSGGNNETGLYAFFGLSNFALLSAQDGYFNIRTDFNPYLHTWSLAVEEQFYLFFPLLLLPWIKSGAAKGFFRLLRNNLVFIIGAVSLAWASVESSRDPMFAFYMLPSRFWELAAGAVLFQCHSNGRCIPQSVAGARVAGVLGLILLVASLSWIDAGAFPFPGALMPVAGTLALISVARSPQEPRSLVNHIFKNRLVVYLGRSSYSIYLWHWPVVVLMLWTVGFDTPGQLAFALALTLALSLASYHFVERPFLTSQALRGLPAWQVVATGLALTVGMAVGFNKGVKSDLRLSVVNKQAGWMSWDMPDVGSAALPGPDTSSPTLWVVGDSHAGAYLGMARQAALEAGMNFQLKGAAGCAIADLRMPYPDDPYCRMNMDGLFDDLARHFTEGDIVFLASLRGLRLSNQWGMLDPNELDWLLNGDRSQFYQEALEQSRGIVGRLLAIGFKVIIDTPAPVFRAPPFRCADWFNRMNPVCAHGFEVPAAELKDLDAPVLKNLHELHTDYPDLVVWDPFPILCPGSVCSAFRNGKPLYFDQDHLSGYGNQLLLPSFSAVVQSLEQGLAKRPDEINKPPGLR
jgi:peptidoglycan/LPS O-acetylase OafA/YrhL